LALAITVSKSISLHTNGGTNPEAAGIAASAFQVDQVIIVNRRNKCYGVTG
jgi:hypothetical protein